MTVASAQTQTPLSRDREDYANGIVGMILFLASWAMMFGALFYSYGLLRLRAPMWPPPGTPEMPLVIPSAITVLLIVSAVAVEVGRKALRAGNVQAFQRMTIAAIVLGVLFMALQAQVWVELWAAGLQIDTDRYGSLFYFLTAFHALHVIVGLGILVWMYGTAPTLKSAIARHGRVTYAAWFWHFVGVVWLIIYALAYVL